MSFWRRLHEPENPTNPTNRLDRIRFVSRRLIVPVVVVVLAAGAAALFFLRTPAPVLPDAGIPEALAAERAARISDLRYDVTFRIPARRTDPVSGHLRATFTLSDATRPLAFDFAQPTERLLAMHANTHIIQPSVQREHIIIPAKALVAGENLVEFEFVAGEAALNRNDDFLYALVRAGTGLGDHAGVRSTGSQGPLEAGPEHSVGLDRRFERPAGRPRSAARTQRGLVFDETEPIPTYLFTFAAGKFSIETAERAGRTFRMFHRETDAAKVARNRDAIFDSAGAGARLARGLHRRFRTRSASSTSC